MLNLKGHAALITGSSKGVGRSIAEAYARAGADVIIHGRAMSDDAKQVLDTCQSTGMKASFVAADLTGPTEKVVAQLFNDAIAAQPNLDILVNNAGQNFDIPFEQMTYDRFEKTMRLNVFSAYFLTQAFATHWIKERVCARVLFIGSINGKLAEPACTAYDVSKGAVEMMVRSLCVALAPHGIRVNGLAPGLVRTPQTEFFDRLPALKEWLAQHTPNGQIPHSDICGPGAVYLVSDVAEHVHGHMLMIDGGMSVWQQPTPPDGSTTSSP